tara:strand:- start:301 stop:516 length:216 start_codon:yes stop_codon:yes gene_type:complete
MLLRFLPADKRAMIDLAMRMVSKLDTPQERQAVAEWGIRAFKDGKITVPEWGELGGKLGILTGPRKNGNGG